MPKFLSLKPSVETPKKIVLKPSVETPKLKVSAPAEAKKVERTEKMKVLIIDSERCMAYIIRAALACTYDVRVSQKVDGKYDLLIAHADDLIGAGADPSKVLMAGSAIPSPIRSSQVYSAVRSFQVRNGF